MGDAPVRTVGDDRRAIPRSSVAIVTAADCGVFCAGMDLAETTAIQQARGVDILDVLRDPFYERMRAIDKPVIAALNGHFTAAGMVLAANADLRVGLAGTRAGITEVRVGRGTPWAVPMLWMLPQAVLLEMLLTGEMLPVERLHRGGLRQLRRAHARRRARARARAGAGDRPQRAAVGARREAGPAHGHRARLRAGPRGVEGTAQGRLRERGCARRSARVRRETHRPSGKDAEDDRHHAARCRAGTATGDEGVLLGHGFYYDQLPVGFRFRTMGRTLTETDLVTFINLIWFTEEVFVNTHDTAGRALSGRIVPGALVYTFAEGLLTPSMQFTGLAFLHTELDVTQADRRRRHDPRARRGHREPACVDAATAASCARATKS